MLRSLPRLLLISKGFCRYSGMMYDFVGGWVRLKNEGRGGLLLGSWGGDLLLSKCTDSNSPIGKT